MVRSAIFALLGAGAAVAAPLYRRVTLDPAATAEAQQKDDTATRAFTAAPIKTADGQCLTVDPLSGDFRENLIPIQLAACNGSDSQQWDVITQGKHINNQPGFALIVSTLTNGCLNFDPRRAAGNQVLLFSCGGRADGDGQVTDSQLFAFDGSLNSAPLVPQNGKNAVCLTAGGQLLDQTSCDPTTASGNELFTIGNGSVTSGSAPGTASGTSPDPTDSAEGPCASPVTLTVTAAPESPSTAAPAKGTTVLDAAAVAEAQQRDDTATRAFSDVQVKTSDGQCLSVDANSGDFRENLIPVTVGACDGSDGQKFDVITAGKHNNVPGTALIVSTLTQGCLNFDPRRAAGNQVLLFSCGGRADGGGEVTNSQLFSFAGGDAAIPLVPTNVQNTCLINNNGNLDVTTCDTASPSADEVSAFQFCA
ncbi:hypothetical protein K435DRAFT_691206 [Dendrothele bispora CBS 962.96]|uniref:Ricin B lectin domain-containing protein n=1 Tax=Dendrothele bispora (strain CBS 962.96) TaxID=1314807 RepID=A0A4S8L2E3_DENBC|nr:hypothetical protein K435DRAFT_691206 [Dendrothele bispora CBS 962.96]